MLLILLQTIVQSIASTLHWIGFYVGVRAWAGPRPRQKFWVFGSAIVATAWLMAIVLAASQGLFQSSPGSPRIPIAIFTTLLGGYLLLLSRIFARSSRPFRSIG